MAEEATERITVAAPPELCFEVADDIERYPEWAADIKEVTVHERDEQGRPSLVSFRAAAFGRSTSLTLPTTTARRPAPCRGGSPRATSRPGTRRPLRVRSRRGTARTEITYHLEVELRVPIPGFIRMRAQSRIVSTALRELRARVESMA